MHDLNAVDSISLNRRTSTRLAPPFISDLWRHRELLWQFTVRSVEIRHKGSHLGLIWAVLNPLLMLGLYVMVFGYIFGGQYGVLQSESRLQYALGIFLSLTLFHFIAEVLTLSPGLVVANPNFVKKVVFPLEVLPAANVAGALFHMTISLCLVLVGIAVTGSTFHVGILWLPVIIAPLLLIGLGLGWLLSALGVFFRDIGQVTQFVSMAMLWGSGVFFSAQNYPQAWTFLRFNPVLLAISLARDVTLWDRPINEAHLLYIYAFGILTAWIGNAIFRRMKPAFADVI
ncbi:MAG: ABC transporter permease [Opitutaceae bacterium]|nr:ABC transporter permease [Opitutaceae bacterium]